MDSASKRIELLSALAVCAELTGTDFSEAAAVVMADDLGAYPHDQVIAALSRCRRELKGRLTLAAILERLDDGRPGPQQAWAMIPQDEAGSVVWCEEMALAFGAAWPLLEKGQTIAARQTFIEVYERECAAARARGEPARWTLSLGHDSTRRVAAFEEAVRLGRMEEVHAQTLTPITRSEADSVVLRLAAPQSPMPPDITAKLRLLLGGKR